VQERARSFDAVADLYDEMRPRYPAALFDDLLAISDVPLGGRVLEVGTGPGVATRPLAQRGLHVLGLEPGPALAQVARDNLAEFDAIEIRQTTFEEAELAPGAFDLVVSASAWHWVDPDVGLDKAARVLRPGGWLAVWWGHGELADPELAAVVRQISERRAPGLEARRHGGSGGRLRRGAFVDQIEQHPGFDRTERRDHPFELTYDAVGFVRLLDTYSHYRLLDDDVRAGLFDELVGVIDTRFGGQVTRQYHAALLMAHRSG
jgi:SAM-dependent methyltransferase